jgi:S-(hydroxymethyl)glutathione dehydrogenase/alcohol dehydrogenase
MPWFMWNKRCVTLLYGGGVPSRDFERIFGDYVAGNLMLDELVTRRYALEDLDEAMDEMMTGHNAKGVIMFDPKESIS